MHFTRQFYQILKKSMYNSDFKLRVLKKNTEMIFLIILELSSRNYLVCLN